ncbi:hypothetical protein F3Y22_tig00110655pilonHSYRG00034 [Hibiscus syriacus]|uniref:Uncharacterized protein n=1 Tax=Hibiscus syriacus TaxID=106335 RepID=A0A6A2ZZF5_HIBSY|nr:hypothetical protein F3Y22_tig00110655pilonHSYRG00034 [Hibiscus syriacus]
MEGLKGSCQLVQASNGFIRRVSIYGDDPRKTTRQIIKMLKPATINIVAEDNGESKEPQYVPRRPYQNQRGGRGTGGGRRSGRGGRGNGRGGITYQNGQNQYYDQPGNYYPRNQYNNRGRGERRKPCLQQPGLGRSGGNPSDDAGVAL